LSSEPVPADLLKIRAPAPDWFRWAISHPGQSQFVMVAGCRIHYLHWARAPAGPSERGLLAESGLIEADDLPDQVRPLTPGKVPVVDEMGVLRRTSLSNGPFCLRST